MGWATDFVNILHDTLNTEKTSGSLTYFGAVYFGVVPGSPTLPYIAVMLDDRILVQANAGSLGTQKSWVWDESWNGAQSRREAVLHAQVEVSIQPGDAAYPYGKSGDASKRGILIALEDVMNALEANRAAILAANSKLVDFNLKVAHVAVAASTWTAQIHMDVKARFSEASR